MFLAGDSIIYSASDLASAARCEYALLREFDAKLGRGQRVSVTDELLARTASLGDEHEQRRLDQLRDEHDRGVAVIGRPVPFTLENITAAADQTMRAIDRGAPVVYQAAMFDGRFVGFADFLVRRDGKYQVSDTKLARSAKVTALLQIAAYADTLSDAGIPVHPEAELILGNGTAVTYQVDELIPVYREQRARLQRLLDDHHAGGVPVRWEDEGVRACFRCPVCEEQVRAADDLLLVAGMRVTQRAKLIDAGITTITGLAEHSGPVANVSARSLTAMVAQAKLQISQRGTGTPQFEVSDARPLALLPNPDEGDLFFDFEGDPLWTADGVDWGLEYLFGVLEGGKAGTFHPLWAHNRPDERKALIDFLALVAKRRKRFPNMHIYHYAAYEKTALLRLAGRHGVGEDEVDDLLRSGTLVDLYPIVRKSIRTGAESLSLKALEPLYMGSKLRSGDVTTATDSITQYALYSELRANGELDKAMAVLKEIEDYNQYDCLSTRELRNWLLIQAFESGVTPVGAQPVSDGGAIEQADALAVQLEKFAGVAASPDRTPEQTAVALVSAARGYHRREDKPFWWAHFNRLNYPVDEWSGEADVFIVEQAKVAVDWHKPPRAHKLQRRIQLTGELARGAINAGSEVYALYDPPAPSGLTDNPDRRATGRAQVMEVNDPSVPGEVIVCERTPPDGSTFHELPFALTPGGPVNTKPLRDAIEAAATDLAAGLPHLPRTAVADILLRQRPRTRSGADLPRSGGAIDDITAALLDLDSSYVAVHGPPGTGKTHTAAHVITRLVADHGWRIGVVAQSHAVVENLLQGAIKAGIDPTRVAKKKSDRADVAWQQISESEYAGFITRHSRMRDRRDGLGLRQPGPGSAGKSGPAGDRRGRPVLPGQHDRGGRIGRQPAPARRPAAAAAGQPGHASRTGRRVRAGLAGRRPSHAARRTRLLPGPHPSHASCGVRTGVGAGLRGPAAAVHRSHRRAAARRVSARAAGASRSPRGQCDREPRRSRGHRRPDPRAGRPGLDGRRRHAAVDDPTTCWCWRPTTLKSCCCAGTWPTRDSAMYGSGPSTSFRAPRRRWPSSR